MKKLVFSLSLFLSFSTLAHAQWATSGTNINNTNTGNVGIGTSSPTDNLQVVTPGSATLGISGSVGNVRDFRFETAGLPRWILRSDGTAESGSNAGSDFSIMGRDDAGALLGTYFFMQRSTGKVGIGTPTPAEKLTINGNIRIMPLVDNTGLFGYDAATGGNSIFSFTRQTNNLSIAAWDGIGFSVSAHTGASANYSMFISNLGNVSIGTTDSKGYKFAVNGSVVATAMFVKLNSAWPDYVFKGDYQLPSLSEVKAYIDQNQHLPEIPSEQQITKEGLNLGEMNKLLMKKVEELTLYLIEKDKQVSELKDRMDRLETKLKK